MKKELNKFLLGLAPDASLLSRVLVLIVVMHVVVPSGRPLVRIVRAQVDFFEMILHLDLLLGRQESFQLLQLALVGAPARLRERDHELDDEPALAERVSVSGHSLFQNRFHHAVLNHLARLGSDENLSLVQGADDPLEAGERLAHRDVHLHDQVVALPRVHRVVFLLQHYYDVTRLHLGLLVAFAAESDLLPFLHAFINVDLENFVGLLGFSSVAVLAPVLRVDPFPLAAAIRTHLLHLLHHAGSDAVHLHLDSLSPATRTFLHGTGFSPSALALVAYDVLAQGQPLGEAVAHVVKGNPQSVDHVLALLRSSPAAVASHSAAATKEHVEYVKGIVTAVATTSFLQRLLAALVIDLTLLLV